MANHGMCDGKCHPSQLWLLQFFFADIPHLNYQINIRECFDTIVSIRGGHAPGTMISILDFQSGNLLWPILQIGNFLRYNRGILYISLSKVQWCVHGHWIHLQRSYEVNVIITLVFWFNPACSIYVKILWYSCPQLCLRSDNSRYQIWLYNNYIFLPGHISSIDSKWYTVLPCTHWKHTSLILVLDFGIFTIYWWAQWWQKEVCYFLHEC